ncbi:OmpA family protein [Hyalangium rubrum]|uniref:OmpA family protein n=1 Tax=Hyalangium rubrum TaxID=3103134 RepID=A0ABU5HCY5_9BACT|nr:OmpA family protein [Hyalangium sp. s54d21]MDY7231317.1 OmpA family protein [Hyalangium sp. s54d21]
MTLPTSSSTRKGTPVARLSLLSALVLSTTALAQPRGLPEFEVERMEFNPGGAGSLIINSGQLLPEGRSRLALIGHFESKPLSPALTDITSETGEREVVLVNHRTTAHLMASYGLADNLEVGLQVPLILSQEQGDLTNSPFGAPEGGFKLGTPIASFNIGVLNQSQDIPVDVAAGISVGFPLGSPDALARENSLRAIPRIMIGRETEGLRAGFELGAALRPRVSIGEGDNREAYNTLRLGASVASTGEGVRYEANVLMWVPFGREFLTAETLVGVRGPLSSDVEVFAMGGLGFGDTLGNPDFRLMLGMAYGGAPTKCVAGGQHKPEQCPDLDDDNDNVKNRDDACPKDGGKVDVKGCPLQDQDKDGVEDAADKCPAAAGVASAQGCPDQDGDGLQDSEDKCPALAGSADRQGCPDTDGDGLDDSADQCPSEAGPVDRKGCPQKDSDNDGLLDEEDSCPKEAGAPELKGCPAQDKDNDTVADHLDNCPTEAGPADNQGCPAAQKQLVAIKQNRIEIKENVYFDSSAATIQARSFGLLDQIAKVINEHPEISKIIIEGHTDDRGPVDLNRTLSQQRAESVATYLSGKGVAKERLESKGFGPDRPVQPNTTAEGRAANRRVDFLTRYDAEGAQPAQPQPAPQQ